MEEEAVTCCETVRTAMHTALGIVLHGFGYRTRPPPFGFGFTVLPLRPAPYTVPGPPRPSPWPRAAGRRAVAGDAVRGQTSEVERQRRGGGAIIEASTAAGA
ncbi:hypothetical protein GCM10010272_70880 [Streptomyces lateritius]|nr:hypothetical protein GCM10010272_70880 [Streptomyces lateritius]